ncbi:MAG: NADH dehydrogenase [Coxiella sp. RIFCSPHIGHO2_12_FULL_44_14]|nr:MAG: NADH dehydrogenase [Coxiella sp. RIFCSPHIGHO2_12_FULL_44_14]
MTETVPTAFAIAASVCDDIDRWLKKYPPDQKSSAVVPALLLVQQQNGGWLSTEAMDAVAAYLGMPPIAVYEVTTFYDMYHLQPIGKNKIGVCTNVPCMLRGSDDIVACLQQRLGISFGETTKDGLFTLRELECMAACVSAPMCQVNDKTYYENLTPKKMLDIVDQLERETHSRAK